MFYVSIVLDLQKACGDSTDSCHITHRQLSLLLQIAKMGEEGSQFIIATHSPILLGLPDASIYSFDNGEVRLCKYEDTECYTVMELFINNREVFLNKLLNR